MFARLLFLCYYILRVELGSATRGLKPFITTVLWQLATTLIMGQIHSEVEFDMSAFERENEFSQNFSGYRCSPPYADFGT